MLSVERLTGNKFLVDNHYAVWYDGRNSRDVLQEMHHKNRMKLIEQGKIDG